MKVGIPKGLLFYKYHPFFTTFFEELGCELIISQDTNKTILNDGVKTCVDEACLPMKVFHGHVMSIKNDCDMLLIPRIMRITDREFICPKFCGLPEMIKNSIPNVPPITYDPLYANTKRALYKWALCTGKMVTKNRGKIDRAFEKSVKNQEDFKLGIITSGYKINIALAGHPYNLYDTFTNMNIVKKLNSLGIGIITEEYVRQECINRECNALYKKPFWIFARNSYGFASYVANTNKVDGVIYISSFACGIDSVVIELIKNSIDDFPFLVLKIDEQTGEAGFNTRIEAFVDMLERRVEVENYCTSSR